MAKILFRLRQVPEEEADDVRQLLDQHNIDWYETSAGKFQISFPAIWVRDDADEPAARQLIETYQHEREERVRAEHLARQARGEVETFRQRIGSNPVCMLLALCAVAFILYISIKPFVSLINR